MEKATRLLTVWWLFVPVSRYVMMLGNSWHSHVAREYLCKLFEGS